MKKQIIYDKEREFEDIIVSRMRAHVYVANYVFKNEEDNYTLIIVKSSTTGRFAYEYVNYRSAVANNIVNDMKLDPAQCIWLFESEGLEWLNTEFHWEQRKQNWYLSEPDQHIIDENKLILLKDGARSNAHR